MAKHDIFCTCKGCTRKMYATLLPRRAARAIVSGAITVAGATASPQQSSTETQANLADSSAQTRRDDNTRTQRSATTRKGRGSSGSSRRG